MATSGPIPAPHPWGLRVPALPLLSCTARRSPLGKSPGAARQVSLLPAAEAAPQAGPQKTPPAPPPDRPRPRPSPALVPAPPRSPGNLCVLSGKWTSCSSPDAPQMRPGDPAAAGTVERVRLTRKNIGHPWIWESGGRDAGAG